MSIDDNTSTHNNHRPGAVRGRPFSKGNPGRKPGSKSKTTVIAAALLQGEETELVRKAIELAKAGDTPMLKAFGSGISCLDMTTLHDGSLSGIFRPHMGQQHRYRVL